MLFPRMQFVMSQRINRYIMECKFVSCAVALANSLRINRYIMECKFLFVSTACIIVLELIDTLWNVNEVIPEAVQGAPGINRYIMECKF